MLPLFVATVLLLQAPVSSWGTAIPLGPVIDVGYTAFTGNDTVPGVHFFGRIPYTRPPLGDLRFRAPKPLDETPRLSPRNASDNRAFGPICYQQPAVLGFGDEGELHRYVARVTRISIKFEPLGLDCLTLNIWKPALATERSNLPVIIYIHVCHALFLI